MPEAEGASREHFERLYTVFYGDIYKYVARRLLVASISQDASDVTADVFMTVWRRIEDVPQPPEDRLWLYGVARRAVARHRRGAIRRERLHLRLRNTRAVAVPEQRDDEPSLRVQAALAALKPRDQEAVYLVLWDGLSHPEAAEILGCSVNALAVRLHRVRSRLGEQLAQFTDIPAVTVDGVVETLKEK